MDQKKQLKYKLWQLEHMKNMIYMVGKETFENFKKVSLIKEDIKKIKEFIGE